LALPAVAGDQLLYRSWRPKAPLVPDACGIPAPLPSQPALAPEQLALLLVPALAVDRRGIRLGSGGGWYDRLRSDPAWRAVPALVVLPSACVVEGLPAEPWDVPFDGWIDEFGCHWLAPGLC
jgi:5-formyltetrahydrofolate cyclo-ligase